MPWTVCLSAGMKDVSGYRRGISFILKGGEKETQFSTAVLTELWREKCQRFRLGERGAEKELTLD